jgi:hypothetical protein
MLVLALSCLAAPLAPQDVFDEIPGSTLCTIGDYDGDQIDDLVIARAMEPSNGGVGRVYLVSGATGAQLLELVPAGTFAFFGQQVAPAGDLDADGVQDVLVSDVRAVPGTVWALSGATGQELWSWDGASLPTGDPLFGFAIAGVGDTDGDGHDDIAVGAPGSSSSSFGGRVSVYSGRTGARRFFQQGLFFSQTGGPSLGYSVAPIGDTNGDGRPDIVVGIPGFISCCPEFDGYLVISGRLGGVLVERSLPGPNYWGASVAAVGDVDQDGVNDFAISDVASAVIVSPTTGDVLVTLEPDSATQAAAGPSLTGYGGHVEAIGDVDGDGAVELAVRWRTGPSFSGDVGYTICKSSTGERLFDLLPPGSGEFFGRVNDAGDLDGDGFDEIAAAIAPISFPSSPTMDEAATSLRIYSRTPENGGVICIGLSNSTGVPASLTASSPSGFQALANDLTLSSAQLPAPTFAILSVSMEKGIVFFPGGSMGRYCLASQNTGRVATLSGTDGTLSYSPDLTSIPIFTPSGPTQVSAMPGDTFNFQLWYRDVGPAGPTSNFSSAVGILFE